MSSSNIFQPLVFRCELRYYSAKGFSKGMLSLVQDVQVLFFSARAMNHGGLKRAHLWVVEFAFGEGYTPEIQHKYRKWWFGRCIWIHIWLIWDTLYSRELPKRNCHVTNFQSQNSASIVASIYRQMPRLGQNAIHEFRSLAPFKEPWKSINSAMPHAIWYDLIYGKFWYTLWNYRGWSYCRVAAGT